MAEPVLTILRGVSGSGKSTWVEKQTWPFVRVSRDTLRMALFGTESFIDEDFITQVEDTIVRDALKAGHHVVVDDTNVNFKYVERLARIAYLHRKQVEVHTFDVSLAIAQACNKKRALAGGRNVPNHVIERQWKMLQDSIDRKPVNFWRD